MDEQAVGRALAAAIKARDQVKISTLRLLKAALERAQSRRPHQPLSGAECLQIISQEAQQRREAIEQFARAGRQELVARERAELDLLQGYLPAPLSREELLHAVQAAIRETGAVGKADMGKVMKAVMEKVRGRADGREVNQVVAEVLSDASGR